MYEITTTLLSIIGIGISFIFFQPYLKTATNRTIAFKVILGLAIVSAAAYLFVKYITEGPDFFESGVKQLKINKYVIDQVGNFQSYSYNTTLFQKVKNNEVFNIGLEGNGKALYLTCVMRQVRHGDWHLKSIKCDSIIKLK